MIRTKLKRKTPMHRKRAIRRTSPERAARVHRYMELAKIHFGAHDVCEKCGSEQELCIHHKRGRTGPNFLDITTWMTVCAGCHGWIHHNPAAALRKKYLMLKD